MAQESIMQRLLLSIGADQLEGVKWLRFCKEGVWHQNIKQLNILIITNVNQILRYCFNEEGNNHPEIGSKM